MGCELAAVEGHHAFQGENLPENKASIEKSSIETREVKKSHWVTQLEFLDLTIPEGAFSIKSPLFLELF